jgi:hypothetical protein
VRSSSSEATVEATVGGALGSLVESDDAIREAVYRPRRAQSH